MINSPEVQAHKPRVLVVTPPPIDEHQQMIADGTRGFTQVRRTTENTRRYAETCREVGSQLGIPVVDIWTTFLLHAGWTGGDPILGSRNLAPSGTLQSLFSDGECLSATHVNASIGARRRLMRQGLHLTPAGYKLVFDEVMKGIKEHYPSLDPDRLAFCYPPWEVAPRWS